jgi:hypothetical protein
MEPSHRRDSEKLIVEASDRMSAWDDGTSCSGQKPCAMQSPSRTARALLLPLVLLPFPVDVTSLLELSCNPAGVG